MLTPEYLSHVADDAIALYEELETSIVRDIVRRLVKTGQVTDTARWQIQRVQEAGLLYDDVIRQAARLAGVSADQLRAVFRAAGIEAVNNDAHIYRAAGLYPLPLALSPAAGAVLTAGYRKTEGYLRNLTMTTASQAHWVYIQAATLAEMQIESGAMDYTTAIREAVRSAVHEGAWVSYPSGHRDRLDVAVRRAVLTGVNQTAAQVANQYADMMGCDLVEVTAHSGARPSHAAWQGKIYSRSGTHQSYPPLSVTGYGTGAGLCGWNCRHNYYPFFEGLSESAYPRAALDEYNNRTVQYNGKDISYYDATQLQRQMERRIRDSKRELAGYDEAMKQGVTSVRDDYTRAATTLKRRKDALQGLLQQTGLTRQTAREQVLGFGRSQAGKAAWAAKLTRMPKKPIIKAAKRFETKEDADAWLRPYTKELWNEFTASERQAAYVYTEGSGKFNRPLRGYDGSWERFVGVGKVPLDNEGAEDKIKSLTDALERSVIPDDVWLFRQSDSQSLKGLLGIESLADAKGLKEKYAGRMIRDPAFFSCAVSKDTGFSGDIAYEILVPKGKKGIYAEPFSRFGGTADSELWDGQKEALYIGSEAEVILQRGTVFRIEDIKDIDGKITVILKVVKQGVKK